MTEWHFFMHSAKGWSKAKRRKDICERLCRSDRDRIMWCCLAVLCSWATLLYCNLIFFPSCRYTSSWRHFLALDGCGVCCCCYWFLAVILFLFSSSSSSENCRYLNKDLKTPYQSVIHTSIFFFQWRLQKYCHSQLGGCTVVYSVQITRLLSANTAQITFQMHE